MAEGGAGDEDGDEEHVAGQGPSAMEVGRYMHGPFQGCWRIGAAAWGCCTADPSTLPCSSQEDECCWICLEAGSRHDLVNPCRCPRKCHPQCMARWQLQQAGRAEETHCRCAVEARPCAQNPS